MSRFIGDMTGNIFDEADSSFGLVTQPNGGKSYKRAFLSPEAQARGRSGFVGLQNQGMTCYLNSLLQTMFLTPELRAGLYQVPLADLGMNAKEMQPEDAPGPAGTPAGGQLLLGLSEPQEEAKAGQMDEADVTLDTLTSMGFLAEDAKRAMKKFPNDVQQAADWLLSQAGLGDKADLADDEAEVYRDLPALILPGTDDITDERFQGELAEPRDEPTSMDVDGTQATLGMVTEDGKSQEAVPPVIASEWAGSRCPLFERDPNGVGGSMELQPQTFERRSGDANGGQEAEATQGAAAGDKDAQDAAVQKPKRRRRGLIIELQKAFAWLQAVDQRAISTEALTKAFGWDGTQAREQHDVHELNRILFDGIEFYLKGTQQETLVKDLYHGMLVNQVECLRCGYVSERQEEFGEIPVVVKGFSSLEESLAAASKEEMLDNDNQYFCERCQIKVDARRSQRFRSLPPLLTLPLCRFEYDWERDERRKITTPFSFPLTLNLAPFMAPPALEGHSAIDDAGQPECVLFDLLSVVIHSGSAHSGHYHAYIRDMLKEGKGQPEVGPSTGDAMGAVAGVEGQVHGGALLEGGGFNEGLEAAGSAMHALVEAAVQESGRAEEEGAGAGERGAEWNGGSASGPGEDEPEYGHWYDFNDSNVTPVHWSAITSQFGGGGSECAYMLTYRARLPPGHLLAAPALAAVKEEAQRGADDGARLGNGELEARVLTEAGEETFSNGSLEEVACAALRVPDHLARLVERRNQQLQEERRIAEETAAREAAEAEAARAANQVRLFVHLPEDGYVRDGHLYSQFEDLSDVGRLLVLERNNTVGQLSAMVRNMAKVPPSSLALYIMSPKIDTQAVEEAADEEDPQATALGYAGLVPWQKEGGFLEKEAESVTEEILLDEEGGAVDQRPSGGGEGQAGLRLDVRSDEGVVGEAVMEVAQQEHVPRKRQCGREMEAGPLSAYPNPRQLTDGFDGVAHGRDERASARERVGGRYGIEKVGTSSSGSSADSRSRGVKRAADGGEPQSRGRYEPEIIRGPQLLEVREPAEMPSSSEGERRSAGAGETGEGSGASISGSAGGPLVEGLNGVHLAKEEDGVRDMATEQPRSKRVRRTIYAVMGRVNMRDVSRRLGDQIQNQGGVLAWSTLDRRPHGVDLPEEEDTTPMEDGMSLRGPGTGWASPVGSGLEGPATGWGTLPDRDPLFKVKVWDELNPNQLASRLFPVETHSTVWMLKSDALKWHREQSLQSVGEDDVVLLRKGTGGLPEPLDDNLQASLAGINGQEELWLRWRPSPSSVLGISISVYGRGGLAASQVRVDLPRSALLVELVVLASERGRAALQEQAQQSMEAGPCEEPQLVFWRDRAFGGRKALHVEEDALRTLEDLGFEDGEQVIVEDKDAVAPETVSVRVHRYVLPHEATADEARAKFLASAMAVSSNPQGPLEAAGGGERAGADRQMISAQATNLAAALTAALTAQRRSARSSSGSHLPARLGKGLGRGLGTGLNRSRARLREIAPGVHGAAPPGRAGLMGTADTMDVDTSTPARLPERLQRTGSSTLSREPDQSGCPQGVQDGAPRRAAASALRFQDAGVPSWCVLPAGEVVLPKSATLAELKTRVAALPAFEREAARGALPLGALRVREVRESQQEFGLGKELREARATLEQLGMTVGKQVAVRYLPPEERPQEEAPLSDCDSLPELVDCTDGDGSSGIPGAAHDAGDADMGEASADLDPPEAGVGLGSRAARLELPTSSGSGTSGGAHAGGSEAVEHGSTSMEVAVGDETGDEVDSSHGLPDPGDLAEPVAEVHPTAEERRSPAPSGYRWGGRSRHALMLTVHRRVPLPLLQIPPVPVNLARRAVQALGPAPARQTLGMPDPPRSRTPPPEWDAIPMVSPYTQATDAKEGQPTHPEARTHVALPAPTPQTIPLPGYLQNEMGAHAFPSAPSAAIRSLPLSDHSLGFIPVVKQSRQTFAESTPPEPSSAAQTGMQVLFHVAQHLQQQTGHTPTNLNFLQDGAPPINPLDPPAMRSPPPLKRQFAFTTPEEVTLDTGRATVTAADLKALLADHFGLPIARLRVIKVDGAKLKVLPEDETPGPDGNRSKTGLPSADSAESLGALPGLGSGQAVGGKGAVGKAGCRPSNSSLGASVNIKCRHLHLRDGDTIVAMDAADDLEQEDTWCASALGPSWGRRGKLAPVPLDTSWEGSGYQKGPSLTSAKKKQRRPEAALRIRMDDFD